MPKADYVNTFYWLLRRSIKYRTRLILSIVFASVSAVSAVIPMVCVYLLAMDLFAPKPAGAGRGWLLAGIAAVSVLVRFGSYLLSMTLSHVCAFNIHYDLRAGIARHIALLPMGFFDRSASGKIKKTMGEDVENIELFIGHYLPDAVAALVLPLVTLGLLFRVDAILALSCLIPLPLAVWMHWGMNRVYRDKVGDYHDNVEKMNSAIVEYVRGMPVIKAFNQTARSFRRYRDALATHLEIAKDWNRRAAVYASFFWLSLDLSLIFILPVGLFLVMGGRIGPPVMVLFLLVGTSLMEPVGRIVMISGLLDRIGEGIARIQSVFDERPLPPPAQPMTPAHNTIEFKNVIFAYEPPQQALKRVSFVLREGTLNGFIGPSGAGKSTAATLITRFWDVTEGEITIGGRNIRDIPFEKLIQRIAIVFQDVYLLNDTVMENIRMGKNTATDQDVVLAAKAAAADEFITTMDQGYATRVGEGGAYMSGGEKQRIAIARAILKDAPIVILDEATAYADPENERRIQQALNTLMTGKTVIVIAHKLPAIMHADQLLLFEKGSIRSAGSHQALMKDSLYAGLWDNCTQSAGWRLNKGGMAHV